VLQPGVRYMDLNLKLQKRGRFDRALFWPAAADGQRRHPTLHPSTLWHTLIWLMMLMSIHSWIPVRVLPWEVRAERSVSRRYPR
jgi:hypothetical protein